MYIKGIHTRLLIVMNKLVYLVNATLQLVELVA